MVKLHFKSTLKKSIDEKILIEDHFYPSWIGNDSRDRKSDFFFVQLKNKSEREKWNFKQKNLFYLKVVSVFSYLVCSIDSIGFNFLGSWFLNLVLCGVFLSERVSVLLVYITNSVFDGYLKLKKFFTLLVYDLNTFNYLPSELYQ